MPDSILVAAEESHLRHVLDFNLRAAGYTVRTAADGLSALAMAAEHRPDLLITDYHLPNLSGLELAHRLHALPATATLPTVLLTSAGYSLPAAPQVTAHFRKILVKPIAPSRLLATLHPLLHPRRAA